MRIMVNKDDANASCGIPKTLIVAVTVLEALAFLAIHL